MLSLLWLIPALPAAGFVLLVLLNRRLGRAGAAWIGAGSVGLSMLAALLVSSTFWLLAGMVPSAVNAVGKLELQVGDANTSYMAGLIGVGIIMVLRRRG
mgnify:CR=1 FL=1